jgi:tetraacyldisaccharide 4'-kinase
VAVRRVARALQRAWTGRGALACALWPISLVFGAIAFLRRAAYRAGVFKSEGVAVPVIVIGNVVAGGSGKTPIVRAIVDHLASSGIHVGIVSRGYGRSTKDCREVLPDSNAGEVGDEPLLLARICHVPVFVARRRVEAVRALLQAHPQTQVIVSDDGLQHYAMQRDIGICVFDERGAGNGWLLPAGPLREPWPRKVDFVLRTADTPRIDGFEVRRHLQGYAIRADGTRLTFDRLRTQRLNAVAAIARPQAFFAMLRDAGLPLALTIALADHDDFAQFPQIDGEIVCTEKDAVKLWRTHPQAWAAPLAIEIAAAFWPAFDALLARKLSSRDGSQTA